MTRLPLAPSPRTLVKPSRGLLQGCDYTPARLTDIRETWARFGWKPIHEAPLRKRNP